MWVTPLMLISGKKPRIRIGEAFRSELLPAVGYMNSIVEQRR
jgi:hypothetical protein